MVIGRRSTLLVSTKVYNGLRRNPCLGVGVTLDNGTQREGSVESPYNPRKGKVEDG